MKQSDAAPRILGRLVWYLLTCFEFRQLWVLLCQQ
jgi:hypothetical protein